MTRLLTTEQTAALLGVSPWTVRAAARRGDLPCMRIGPRGLYRFDPRAIHDLLDEARGRIEGAPPVLDGARGRGSVAEQSNPAAARDLVGAA